MKGFERMSMEGVERMKMMRINHGLHRLAALTLAMWGVSAYAATGTSAEFKVDLRGMGPWEMRTAAASEAIAYSSAWATNALSGANAVVKVWPVKREKPKYIAIDLSGGTAATHYPIEHLDDVPDGGWTDEYKTTKLVLRHIPAGSFIMGGRATDYPGAVNTNLHMVTLTKDFYLGVFEVTQRQWELVMGNRPSAFTNETCYATRPVESVSYQDIRGMVKGVTWPETKEVDDDSFMGVLRKKSGLTGFDLPTEAQWEYSCRAGTTTALSNGKNLSSMSNAVELAEMARYSFNSGWALATVNGNSWTEYNCTQEKGTAKVGSYPHNPFDLYDMDGNVCEIAIDVYENLLTVSIDPVGPSAATSNKRVYCGGCWRFPAFVSSSGSRHGGDLAYSHHPVSCGFRLCLQGGEIPETTAGVELVNAAGTGDVGWTPTKAGTYYLTHETQINGINAAEVLHAWFTVAGPELTFTPDGALKPGVNVAIGGAGAGWTIHYTTNGSAPTAESPEYSVPITLNDSATIRAVVYSDGGMASEEFSATFSLMSVVNAVAKPRYPWNGKVDIDCEVRGESGHDYAITLEARDLDGGTNLPLRTAWQVGGAITNNIFLVQPGTYRFTWNADADIAGDGDFPNVAVSVKAEGGATIGAKKVLEMIVNGYTGTETLTNVPTLVRLSTVIEGFDYADFADANGGDLIFCDEGESVIYAHEIDEWHVGGESLVWVKLPTMTNGTKFKAAWGGRNGVRPSQKGEVWSDYAGVWHMNEDSGTAYDSTAHRLDALPSRGTNTLASISHMVAYESGVCGRARVSANEHGFAWYEVPSYDALKLGIRFVASGWYRANQVVGYPKFFYRNNTGWADGGWGAELRDGSPTKVTIVGSSKSKYILGAIAPTVLGNWVNYTFAYDGTSVSFYTNGVFAISGEIVAAGENGLPLKIAADINGQCDEIRMRGGSLSADRIKADYDMVKNLNFLTYGPVESGSGGGTAAATTTADAVRLSIRHNDTWYPRTAATTEAITYSTSWATNALSGANAVVKVWPVKKEKPKYIALDLSGGTAATRYPIEYLDDVPDGGWTDEYKTSKLVLRHIPAGSFIMGGRNTDYSGAVNTNLHMVTLTKDFYMGVFEVTQRQWELVMGNRPSYFTNELYYAARPVERISYVNVRGSTKGLLWPDSKGVDDVSFMGVLRKKSSLTCFDLPTEAQWEYACRAGTTTALNSGENLIALTNCLHAAEVARYLSNQDLVYENDETKRNYSLQGGTAWVGSYCPNAWGLYDMHGNVWEECLDKQLLNAEGSVDPIGNVDVSTVCHQVRGGGWQVPAVELCSGYHRVHNNIGHSIYGQNNHVGFRLCLQGGEIPDMTAGMELVNTAGTGDAAWTPTKVGTYYLTHETQTNGVNGAEVLGTWFTVAGPELTFTPDGALKPGVNVAIGGAGAGWHVYYTLDGSAPTQSSASEYTAPITLNDSQTIRAIAFSDGGLESREFSATYSLMSVGSAVAKPRYPWNGKVDIDCEVKGDASLEYLVSLAALDLDGNTNLPLRTAWLTGGSTTNNAFLVKPGTYRFTWDADADIADDCDFANVAVSVSAEGSAIIAAKKVLPLEVAGYTGTETLTNVPVLVRLSTAIAGFSYADFAEADGGDLIFTDESGSVVYPHEIDEWHTDGESLVWVRLPVMANGTRFKAAYGNPNYSLSTINYSLAPHAVWSDYAGVWHFNEDSGTAFDSTAHGLDALPSKGTNTLADISQMVAYENGACGRARVNATQNGKGLNYLCTPASSKFAFGGEFVAAGWFRIENLIENGSGFDDPRLISTKPDNINQKTGFELQFEDGADRFCCKAQTNSFLTAQTPSALKSWVNLVASFADTNIWIYANGSFVTNGTIKAVVDDPAPAVAIGSGASGVMWSLNGQYDEIRLRGGTLSADRIKADYDMIKNRNFLGYGPVENGKGVAE
ncbi:MAG: SUMF1/EgtB/PvdO family nonheme iron enzyme [Kiritimatiellae bacterium]|nr:SUMF1/EgtB/PvdO family nonheme iron enzyme [Kiritimatiellia bacterium]